MLQSSSLHSFCPSLLLFFFLDASGNRILFVSSSPICFRVRSPCCLKLVSVLLYLLLFFSLGTFGTQSSPCFPPVSVLVSLVDPLLSVLCFGCFGERTLLVSHLFLRPSLCLFSTCSQLVLTLLSSLLLLPAHRMLIGCSLSIVCFRTCRPCCLHFVPFFLSFLSFFFLSLSPLSLLLFFFLGACWDP